MRFVGDPPRSAVSNLAVEVGQPSDSLVAQCRNSGNHLAGRPDTAAERLARGRAISGGLRQDTLSPFAGLRPDRHRGLLSDESHAARERRRLRRRSRAQAFICCLPYGSRNGQTNPTLSEALVNAAAARQQRAPDRRSRHGACRATPGLWIKRCFGPTRRAEVRRDGHCE